MYGMFKTVPGISALVLSSTIPYGCTVPIFALVRGVIRHRVQGRRERERHRYEEGTYRFVHSGVKWGSLPIVGMIIFEF